MAAISRYYHWLHGKWPSGATEKMPKIAEDGQTDIPGVRVVGDLTGVPLLKFSADTGAKAIDGILAENDFKPGDDPEVLDVAIIGAGVSGISAAIQAKKAGLRYEVFESQESFSTIRNFPRRKPIYTYPTNMEPAGEMRFRADVKEDLLVELEAQRVEHGIETTVGEVDHVEHGGSGLKVVFKEKSGRDPQRAQRVIVAIGRTGNFRKLNVPGENLDKVSNRLIDAREFKGQKVLVVGGGDSALEAAISLAEEGAEVTLSYRSAEFKRPKPDNIDRIQQMAKDGELALMMRSNVQDIGEESVTICDENDQDVTKSIDQVFILIGREPPLDFFRKSKVSIIGELTTKSIIGLVAFLAVMTFLYHLKAYKPFLGIPGTNLWQVFSANKWFPFNLPIAGGDSSFLHVITKNAASDPGFLFAFLYTMVIVIFGVKRIKRRKTPYVTRQTLTLMAFQVIPLFILPYVVLPWMGANGWFTSGGIGEWFGMTFLSNGPGTTPDQYWRAFGFILAWPLFIYNVFTPGPLWGWLVLSLIQTFIIIPLIVRRWGKGAYCGWICSCGAMAETLGDQHRHKMPHGPKVNRLNMIGQAILAIAFLLLALRVVGWVVPNNGFNQFVSGLIGDNSFFSYKVIIDLWLAGAIGYGLYFHYSGRVWCRFACPLAALMHIYARFSKFRIFADKKKCISCNACTSICHQGIDIMNFANKGLPLEDPECVRCSACVQVCPTGVLNFGRFDKNDKAVLERLWASPVQMREAEISATPIDDYLSQATKKV